MSTEDNFPKNIRCLEVLWDVDNQAYNISLNGPEFANKTDMSLREVLVLWEMYTEWLVNRAIEYDGVQVEGEPTRSALISTIEGFELKLSSIREKISGLSEGTAEQAPEITNG